jgi:hypothetical protein
MKAYHSDEAIKKKYVARLEAHAKVDEIVKGQYWENGKGCAVGCTVHSGNHAAYETELGIPQWMARLEDRIFEGLPNERAMTWPLEFLQAIKPGVDLQQCFRPMLIAIVESAKESARSDRSKQACEGVLIELRKEVLDLTKLREARAAAYAAYAASASAAAAYAAASAAYADAASADAASADAASYAAYASAYAAKQNAYVKFANKLLELIGECK